MLRSVAQHGVSRREFMSSALSLGGLAAAVSLMGPSNVWGAVAHKPLDPVNPDILFGTTSSLWGTEHDIAWAIRRIAALGLQGIEPYGNNIETYRSKPLELKKLFDAAGITFIDASNGEMGQSTNFIDPAEIPKTIADHVAFARDFLQPLGARHWKCNMGNRPAGGPTDDQLKRLSDTLNEIGRQTIAMGIKMAPHPHIWGPMERERDVRRVMELTDPKYVWLTTDTGHLVLGGMDPVKIMDSSRTSRCVPSFHPGHRDRDCERRSNASVHRHQGSQSAKRKRYGNRRRELPELHAQCPPRTGVCLAVDATEWRGGDYRARAVPDRL